ncbi:bifunctional ADP-dependent NAD(P)H-hydrate dehydratase/NAD(P)H-hydrate epimerase [Cochleicola gelatinilyticus]|uniref:Bifunctional NAD(P)H-hydrate repair enzyme n=1 Tax=Cochleicola gelatinilyticus TaxID=1763537 RepID=A0A167HUU4_9FLAO|nr:bifunctional ADP-dependent NAD(P)H-hydrate dehydratase/NAD(P)H-hydrate epimerase [Cochleicola gelatinilyticus]OAB78984.1 carbohydrate kinase [Cochleicola gelatinilyticus]
MKIFSAEQLHQADKVTTKKHEITSLDLMERAGSQIFNWLHQRLQGAPVPIHIFCGIGNNGGDGLVVGRLLIENGYSVTIYVANFTDKRSKCFLVNYDKVKSISKKWPVLMTSEEDFPQINKKDIVIDALFGIGLNRSPEGWVKKLIQHINTSESFTLSIDMPSGMYADTATEDFDAVVEANHVLTFQAPKFSFFLPETGKYAPYFEALDIGLDPEFLHTTEPLAQLILKPQAQQFYRQRKKYDHKGTFGHALIIAGSYGKMGAAILSSKAAFRIGAGLVTCFVPECGYQIVQTAIPEAMTLTDKEDDLITNIEFDIEVAAIGVGMGIGTKKETVAALQKLFSEAKAPMVIDADALNCISENESLLKVLPKQSVLTPHPGELKRLIGDWKNDFDKIEKTKKFSEKYEVVVLIKGANTMTIFGDMVYINSTGNPGMATAGSGDVLSGVITGLLSQGYDPLLASVFGVYLHGSAGNIVSQQISFEAVMASDIADTLGDAYIELFAKDPVPGGEQQQ